MAKLFRVFVACFAVVILTSCSARIEYNWSRGLSLSEFTESYPELVGKITSDNTISENNGTAYDGGRLPASELSAQNMPISDKAHEYFYNSFQQHSERWSESDIYSSVLSELEAVAMITKEFYPVDDGVLGVYGLGLRTSPNPGYYEVYHITETGNRLIYSDERGSSYPCFLCDGNVLYFIHNDGILSKITTDGAVIDLYDARVMNADNTEYAEMTVKVNLSGEDNVISCKSLFHYGNYDDNGDFLGYYFRTDEFSFDVAENKLISRTNGEWEKADYSN